jgi:hypothetical protein
MVLPERIELSTSPLPRECSTTELRQRRGPICPRTIHKSMVLFARSRSQVFRCPGRCAGPEPVDFVCGKGGIWEISRSPVVRAVGSFGILHGSRQPLVTFCKASGLNVGKSSTKLDFFRAEKILRRQETLGSIASCNENMPEWPENIPGYQIAGSAT